MNFRCEVAKGKDISNFYSSFIAQSRLRGSPIEEEEYKC